MTYYDYDLGGEYQSSERALSFIHAMKEVLSDYDDAPNLADEWRCLLPFNYNVTYTASWWFYESPKKPPIFPQILASFALDNLHR